MRLKLLTNLNTLLLISACAALSATLYWSQRALEQPYQLMASYLSLSQSFQQNVAQNIQDYLASGDALRHSAASQGIKQFTNDLDSLPRDLASDLQPSLLQLQTLLPTTCSLPANWQVIRKVYCCRQNGK